jgi:hypothetical protein
MKPATLRTLFCLLLIGANLMMIGPLRADDPHPERSEAAYAMAERIDELLAESWKAADLTPAPLAGDAEFLRRVHLDLGGVIPRVSEVREFLADESDRKRQAQIQKLLDAPNYASHQGRIWRKILLPDGFQPNQLQDAIRLERWLRLQFADNLRYDRLVADFLVSGGEELGPALFYTSQELQPEKLAASTARIFLGLQIECAQCHDHPYDRWKQKDFWGLAAFFARLGSTGERMMDRRVRLTDRASGEVTLPGSNDPVQPTYPGGGSPAERSLGSRRTQLAVWVSSRENPYLARAVVNRAWGHMFGRGLVEPVDDLGPHNPPSHPELLEELTAFFIRSGYDLQQLYGVLANTKAYQRTSRWTEGTPPSAASFARMAIKPLTAEQLYLSMSRCLPVRDFSPYRADGQMNLDPVQQAFLAKMQTAGRSATEYDGGVLQSLTMMNGSETANAANAGQLGLLAALQAPHFTNPQRVETLWLATLARAPDDLELAMALEHLEAAATDEASKKALGDVLWALLNSVEFAMNH